MINLVSVVKEIYLGNLLEELTVKEKTLLFESLTRPNTVLSLCPCQLGCLWMPDEEVNCYKVCLNRRNISGKVSQII